MGSVLNVCDKTQTKENYWKGRRLNVCVTMNSVMYYLKDDKEIFNDMTIIISKHIH